MSVSDLGESHVYVCVCAAYVRLLPLFRRNTPFFTYLV